MAHGIPLLYTPTVDQLLLPPLQCAAQLHTIAKEALSRDGIDRDGETIAGTHIQFVSFPSKSY
jgi:hypothetical protein